MSKISHMLQVIIALQYNQLVTASKLSKVLDVDKKTIYRYIDSLNKANIPVHTKKGRYGGFYIDENFYMKPFKLNRQELESLLMASTILTRKNGFNYEMQLKDAVCKIKKISVENCDDFKDIDCTGNFYMDDIGNTQKMEYKVHRVNESMSRGRSIKIQCFSINKDRMVSKNVDPYDIIYKEGSWYLIAYCHANDEIRSFEMSRIRKIDITEDTYMIPHTFSLEKYLDQNHKIFYGDRIKIVVRFTGKSVEFIENGKWHFTQETEKDSQGNLMFTVYLNDTDDIKCWLLGFGSDAEVIEPLELRNKFKCEIDRMAEKYKTF